jgi:hypothetical protein
MIIIITIIIYDTNNSVWASTTVVILYLSDICQLPSFLKSLLTRSNHHNFRLPTSLLPIGL